MSDASSWVIRYIIVALFALFAGPLLSKLPAVQTLPITLLGLGGAQTIRLVIGATSLVLLCLLSIRAFRQMPDNGKGFSFIRGIIVPATALFVIIAADKTLRVAGLHLIERVGHQLYTIVYTAGLLLTGIWISAAWLFNMHTLHRFFAPPPQPAKRKETALLAEDGCEPRHEEESGETQTATVILPTNGGPPTTLGRYKVLKEIGRGAMGVVYLGKDPTIQRFVAIKTMSLHSIEDAETLREEKSRLTSSRSMTRAKNWVSSTSPWRCWKARRSSTGHGNPI
jgi:serine/threonine-protein kinase